MFNTIGVINYKTIDYTLWIVVSTDLFSNQFLEDLEYLFMLKDENLVR